ncbi:MAG TPA: c-type cytochrome, partial [Luteitalea sp.]|nr:c-type cytochrome [Luteitalea sp.]
DAAARPMGLAQGPDGALYITESVNGKIWRVTYKGDKAGFGSRQLAAMAKRKTQQQHIRNPHEQDDVIGKEVFAAGAKVYETYCVSCHQRDAKGDGARFPPLAGTNWVTGNKQRLISIVVHGLNGEIEVEGRRYNDVMPAHGFLTDDQIAQVLTYLRQNFGNYGQGVLKDEVAAVRTRAPWTPQTPGPGQPGQPGQPGTPRPAPTTPPATPPAPPAAGAR